MTTSCSASNLGTLTRIPSSSDHHQGGGGVVGSASCTGTLTRTISVDQYPSGTLTRLPIVEQYTAGTMSRVSTTGSSIDQQYSSSLADQQQQYSTATLGRVSSTSNEHYSSPGNLSRTPSTERQYPSAGSLSRTPSTEQQYTTAGTLSRTPSTEKYSSTSISRVPSTEQPQQQQQSSQQYSNNCITRTESHQSSLNRVPSIEQARADCGNTLQRIPSEQHLMGSTGRAHHHQQAEHQTGGHHPIMTRSEHLQNTINRLPSDYQSPGALRDPTAR